MRLQNRATIDDFKNAQNNGIYIGQKGGNYRSPLTPPMFYFINLIESIK
jgi:hypothetical protein